MRQIVALVGMALIASCGQAPSETDLVRVPNETSEASLASEKGPKEQSDCAMPDEIRESLANRKYIHIENIPQGVHHIERYATSSDEQLLYVSRLEACILSPDEQDELSMERPGFSEEYRLCASDLPRVDTMQCIEAEYNRADAALNETYRQVMKNVTPERKAELRLKQRQWLGWLDEYCENTSAEGMGPVGLNQIECSTLERIRRTEWIANQSS